MGGTLYREPVERLVFDSIFYYKKSEDISGEIYAII